MNTRIMPYLFQEEIYWFSVPLVVVLPKPWNAYSADDHVLLKKIITSVKLDINTVQLVVDSATDLEALAVYSPARVLIFGSDTVQDLPFYTLVSAQPFTVIRADDLPLLDEEKKKNLWTALKQMFGV